VTTLFGERSFGSLRLRADRPFLVAEAGVNHENDLSVAMRMIDQAAAAGADAIKFQSYKAGTLASRHSPAYWDLGSEPTRSQYDLFRKYDSFGDREYRLLAEHAGEAGIAFLSTPFDDHFVDALEPLMPAYKIASADLTNLPFLAKVAAKGKPVILSTGAATVEEVAAAVDLVRARGNAPVAILHCILCYPCAPADANLRVIAGLAARFPDLAVGYSDHVPPTPGLPVLTAAWLLGARILEKHFTLDKTLPGNDHYHAMNADDIRQFRRDCAYATSLLGEADRKVFPCEEAARLQARRSLVAACAIPAGTVVTREMLLPKRPGTGIPPGDLERLLGRRALRPIAEDQILQWDMFEAT
jgi:sialic acid synthase SpsE